MTKIFISYSHKDEEWKDLLQNHLSVLESQGKLDIWEDRQIEVGNDWLPKIEKSIADSNVSILLISRHFLTSKFILSKEVPLLLKRRENDGLCLFPLIISPCAWQAVDWLKEIQGYPKDNKPLAGREEFEIDELLADLSNNIHQRCTSEEEQKILDNNIHNSNDETFNKPVVLVIPHKNSNMDKDEDLLCNSVAEEILTRLKSFRTIKIIPKIVAWTYFQENGTTLSANNDLGINHVAEVKVEIVEKEMVIKVVLNALQTNNVIFQDNFRTSFDNPFIKWNRIVELIAGRLVPKIDEFDLELSQQLQTLDYDAWSYNQQGRYHFFKFTKDGNAKAALLFELAIQKDPNYAQPYAWLAYNTALGMVYFDVEPSDNALAVALEAAKKAVDIDPKDAWSHMAIARVHLARGDYVESEKSCRIAIELNSSLAHAHCLLGDALTCMNKIDLALKSLMNSIELSPEDPWRWAFFAYASVANLYKGNYRDAKKWSEKAIEIPGCQFWAYSHRVVALAYLGQDALVQSAIKELLQRNEGFSIKFAKDHLFYLKNPQQLETYLNGLRKAGLAE